MSGSVSVTTGGGSHPRRSSDSEGGSCTGSVITSLSHYTLFGNKGVICYHVWTFVKTHTNSTLILDTWWTFFQFAACKLKEWVIIDHEALSILFTGCTNVCMLRRWSMWNCESKLVWMLPVLLIVSCILRPSIFIIICYQFYQALRTHNTHTHTSQGIEEKLRKEAWKYLLGYMPFGDTDIERMDLRVVS